MLVENDFFLVFTDANIFINSVKPNVFAVSLSINIIVIFFNLSSAIRDL